MTKNCPALTIRPLQSADAAAFIAVRLAALREFPAAFGSSYEEEAGQNAGDPAVRLPPAADGSYWYLGAFADGFGLVGILAFQRAAKRKQQHGGSLYGAYVVPDYRGKGVGRTLVSAAIAQAKSLPGMRFLQLWVGLHNQAAQALYRSAGFKRCGTLPAALHVEGNFYDEALMVLDLASA